MGTECYEQWLIVTIGHAQCSLGEGIPGKAANVMDLEREHPRSDAGIVFHDASDLVDPGVEDPDPAPLTVVHDGTHDGEKALGPEGEVAPSMLPDDGVDLGGALPVRGLQEDHGVGLGLRQHLAHELVADRCGVHEHQTLVNREHRRRRPPSLN